MDVIDGRTQIESADDPDTYILGRDKNTGYVCFDNDAKIAVVHFRRNGSILHCHQISPDRRKGRSEIVGHVGYELLLVILCICDLSGHIVECSRKISHLIAAVH